MGEIEYFLEFILHVIDFLSQSNQIYYFILFLIGMEACKTINTPLKTIIILTKDQSPRFEEDRENIYYIPHISNVGNLMYVMVYTH